MAATITWSPKDIANFLKADSFSEKVRARIPNYKKPVELISRGVFLIEFMQTLLMIQFKL